jgi:hypothetical protein
MCVSYCVRARRLTPRPQATGALDGRLLALRYDLGITRIHYHPGVGYKHSMIQFPLLAASIPDGALLAEPLRVRVARIHSCARVLR